MTRKEKQIIIKQVQIAKEISERYLQEWLKTDYTNTKEREQKNQIILNNSSFFT